MEMFLDFPTFITSRFSMSLLVSNEKFSNKKRMSLQPKKQTRPHFNGFLLDCGDPNILFVTLITNSLMERGDPKNLFPMPCERAYPRALPYTSVID
jgi:hypothetical protein